MGEPHIKLADDVVRFSPNKSYQALAYLAYQSDWVSRDELAFLFWADEDSSKARHNVRQLLKRLGKLDWPCEVEADRHRLRWQVKTDVAQFDRAVNEQRWYDVSKLYQGTFLTGLDKKLSTEYEDWLELSRNKLQGQWRDALLNYSQDLEQLGQLEQASQALNKLLEHDALDEEVVRQIMQLSLQTGQRDQGLKAYEIFSEQLQDELGLEPTTLTQQLAESIRESGQQRPASRTQTVTQVKAAPRSILANDSSFIGRDLELSEIAHLLSKPDCRLLTLLGMGGIGKSRTALQAAEELKSRYPDGVYVVGLEPITNPTGIPSQLANRLRVSLQGKDSPLEQVKRAIGDKAMFIVLDNFEHLMDGVSVVSDLLDACPNLDILVTSRERLMLEQEWLLPLEGLSFPDAEVSLEDALRFDAMKLFVERAQRMRPNYSLDEADLSAVLNICQLVEGSPLGIELAAVWVRAMPVAEIAKEIEQSLDFLESAHRNVKDRHQSLRATFEYSWKLLSSAEQDVLKKLSVFRGGFKKAAASHVAGASIAILAALVDKSLLRMTLAGRYERHPLIYQFTQDKLAQDERLEFTTQAKHASYFHAYLKEAEGRLETRQVKAVLAEMDDELDNLRVAWQWMIDQKDALKLRESSTALHRYFDTRALSHEGLAWFEQMLDALNPDHPEHLSALGYAMQQQARFLFRQGRFDASHEKIDAALPLLKTANDTKGRIAAYSLLSHVSHYVADSISALEACEKALSLARTLGNKTPLIHALNALGNAYTSIDLTTARGYYEEALALCREIDSPSITVIILANLGGGYLYLGGDTLPQGRDYLEESLALARDLAFKATVVENLHDLGYIYIELDDIERAYAYCQEAAALLDEFESRDQLCKVHMLMGEILMYKNEFADASAEMKAAMHIAWDIQNIYIALETIRLCAQINLAEGKTQEGLRRFAFVMKTLDQQIFPISIRRNRQWWQGFTNNYAGEAIEAAEAWAQTVELEAVIVKILQE